MADDRRGIPDYDLEAILREFGDETPAPADARPEESLADRSKRLVMKTMDDTFDTEGYDLLGGIIEETAARQEAEQGAQRAKAAQPEKTPDVPTPPPVFVSRPKIPEIQSREVTDGGEPVDYAAAGAGQNPDPELDLEPEPSPLEQEENAQREKKAAKKKERLLSPLVGLMAMLAVRREKAGQAAKQQPLPPEGGEKEPDLKTAMGLYGKQMRFLLLRARFATALSLVMLYLTWGWTTFLPLTGALKSNYRVMSLLQMVFCCIVIICGLDIFTGGLLAIPRRRMNAETLVSVSCVLSLLDALILAVTDVSEWGLPVCAVSAMSMTFALWGAYFTCKNARTGLKVLSSIGQTCYTVTAESGLAEDDMAILKTRRQPAGFLTRSEEEDVGESLYHLLTPFLLIGAAILGVLAAIAGKHAGAFLHCVSILLAAATGFATFVCFAVPFARTARRLSGSGAAIAGWSGLRELGTCGSVVVRDQDLFPRGTVEVERIRILESVDADKVISYTGSVVAASGNSLAGAFTELLKRNNCAMRRVDAFAPRDGGGVTAVIAGESIYIGGSGFMNLVGIRLPQAFSSKNALYVAISGRLVGIFEIKYHPVNSVHDALIGLLQSPFDPIFAIRDFNITPSLVQTGFRLPTNDLRFPSYSERYRVSAAQPDKDSRQAAVIIRDGLAPLVDVAELSRKTRAAVIAGTVLAAAGSILGLILTFVFCWIGAFDMASAGNLLLVMLVWCLVSLMIPFFLEQ